MNCPFCNKEMIKGIISGDGRSRVAWKAGDKKRGLVDALCGIGKLTAPKYSLASFMIESFYCTDCKKMIFDTEIES